MKKLLSIFILFFLPMLASATTVSDVKNSGCLDMTRGDGAESLPTIVLTKEGSVLSVQLLNYESNCGTTDFNVTSAVSGGSDSEPCSVNISVVPVVPAEMDCICPYNVSFTVRDVEVNSFYLSCWWYEGLVELTEGEPLVLEYKVDNVTTDDSDYVPFVKENGWKSWFVIRSNAEAGCHHDEYRLVNEKVEKAGKIYVRMNRIEDYLTKNYDVGFLREEDRKVYIFDSDMQEEHLMFDYSLKAGDTYETYSYDEQKEVTYKVLSVSDYLEGPEAFRYDYDEEADSMIIRHRYLKKWTVCRTDNESLQKIWIEGVGSLEGPLGNLRDVVLPSTCWNYLAYVENYDDNYTYLPFSFCDTWNRQVHGCNLPTGAESKEKDEWGRHHLTYELEGDRLHVFGDVFTQCGPNNYAYFYEKKTDDPLVHKIEFKIQEVEPLADCMALHQTDFYVPGFDPNLNYIVADNHGEEHPVINKTPQNEYRPFVEEGKIWKVGGDSQHNLVQLFVEYYYFDGDTIIGGKTCKQMMRQRYVNPDYPDYAVISQYPMLSYVGAWYEEDKKVYLCNTTDQQFKLMYDFSVNADDTLLIHNQSYVIGPKQTGGLNGFKGVYRDVRLWAAGNSMYNTTWLEGVGNIDGPIYSVYLGKEGHTLFLMSCTVGDEVIYLNDVYDDGATPAGARKRFDFSHTIKTKPQARNRSGENQSLYGEYNDLQLGINLDPLDDAYLVSITDDAGKVVYEKSVNAGNIVGLNIDISSYAKGRYTITVENSDEIFTGEFDAQATGIRDVRCKKEEGRGQIYNLQGQRLSTLQKGLNIVNGQKIIIK